MSYALNTTQSLNWIVRSATEVETNIVSIERIQEYIDLPSEAPLVIPENRPDDSWPAEGAIVFDDYSTRYREGLDLVLKGVSFTIKPGTKVGVCGRTGAGKSTLTLAIYRVIERVGGKILIDDVSEGDCRLSGPFSCADGAIADRHRYNRPARSTVAPLHHPARLAMLRR